MQVLIHVEKIIHLFPSSLPPKVFYEVWSFSGAINIISFINCMQNYRLHAKLPQHAIGNGLYMTLKQNSQAAFYTS